MSDHTVATENWCIVGGGMLGMSLALKLTKEGRKVTLMEAAPNFGGLADAWEIGPYTWDRFYHVTLLSDKNIAGLLEAVGLKDQLNWTTTKTDFYTDRQFHPLNNVVDYLKFPPLNLIDKGRLAFTIIYASLLKNGVRLESIPVGKWLTTISGKTVYERIWQPLLRAKLGENHKIASASFIWSVINRFYAARRSGLQTEMFGYVKGGYGRILKNLEETLVKQGVSLRASAPVSNICEVSNGVQVTADKGAEVFDRVIVTAPGTIAARMAPTLDAEELEKLSSLKYQGVICCSVLLKKPLRERYLTYIADEAVPLTGIIEMTAVVDKKDFGGNSLVYLPQYVPADDPLFEATDEVLQKRAIDALKHMYPDFSEDDIVAFRVSKARNVMAVQGLNYSQKAPKMDTSIKGLHLVNSAQIINGNLNVDETIALANRAAVTLEAMPTVDHANDTQPAVAAE